MNISKIVLIIYLLILSEAEQVFKEIYNFINKFIAREALLHASTSPQVETSSGNRSF